MKQERKAELIHSFPSVPQSYMDSMKGKGYENFAVMLTHGDELFVRCFHRYTKGTIVERQRYVFAKDGYCRYLSRDDGKNWRIASEFREPVFNLCCFGYNADNSYSVLNIEAIKKSCMKYSQGDTYMGHLLMEYLRFYYRHRNVEYLMKQGYSHLLYEVNKGWWGNKYVLQAYDRINWKSNNLLKMLDLSKTEFAKLKGNEGYYESYILWREIFPKYKPDELLTICKTFGHENGILERFCSVTKLSPYRISRYINDNRISKYDYSDYLNQCLQLEYNLHDTAVSMPRDFYTMHERLSNIIGFKKNEKLNTLLNEKYNGRKILEYNSDDLFVRQPDSVEDIIAEGKRLSHCVGGYAERHAKEKLHIMFLRKKSSPNASYYTIEVDLLGRIIQCRGYKNDRESEKPQEIIDFEKEYQQYLDSVFSKKRRKTA